MGLELVVAIGIATTILVLLFAKFGSNEEEKHPFLQLILLFFIVGGLLLLGKAGLDHKENCEWLNTNSTVTGNTTSYNYSYTCSSLNKNTANVFYESMTWFLRILAIYVFLYFMWEILKFFNLIGGGKGEGT